MSEPTKIIKKSELTKEAILKSARDCFREHSYDQVGVREICSGAGVSSALINRYFGSKLELFREVLLDSTDYSEVYSGPACELGERIAQFLVSGTIATKNGEPLIIEPQKLLLFIRSLGCPEALPVLREALQLKVTSLLSAVLPSPFINEKSALITSHIFGFVVIHRMVGATCVAKAERSVLTTQLAQSIQVVIDHGSDEKDFS